MGPLRGDLKYFCRLYGWNYKTMWKRWNSGEFVQRAWRNGKKLEFDVKDVEAWANREPVTPPMSATSSLIRGQL